MPYEAVRRLFQWKRRGLQNSCPENADSMDLTPNYNLSIANNDDNPDGSLLATSSEGSDERRYFQWMRKATEIRPLQRMYSWAQRRNEPQYTDLIKSISDPDSRKFKKFLANISSEQLSNITSGGQSLLHMLCFRHDEEKLSALLQKNIQVDRFNVDGLTPLHIAVQTGWMEGLQILMRAGASSVIPSRPGPQLAYREFCEKPILTAARNGDSDIVFNLMSNECDLGVTDRYRNSLLHLASYSRSLPMVRLLLEQARFQDSVDPVNILLETPLHSLFPIDEDLEDWEEDVYQVAFALLRQGADPNKKNFRGKTVLFLAARSGLPKVVQLLLEWGADSTILAENGKSVVHAACRAGSSQVLGVLFFADSEKVAPLICAADDSGFPPFYYAVMSSSVDCCLFLLNHGDHLINTDFDGISRFEYANANMANGTEMLQKMFDSRINVYSKTKDDTNFEIEMDFSVLLAEKNIDEDQDQQSLIDDFDDSKAYLLLSHPLVEAFLHLKWNKIRWFFYCHVVIYAIFLFFHSFYVLKTFCMSADWEQEIFMYRSLYVIHIVFLLLLSIFGLLYIMADLRKYVKQYETYFNLTAIVTSAVVVFAADWGIHDPEAVRTIAAVSIFMCWIEFMMLLGRIPALGIYVFMFTRVSLSVIKFVWPFTSLILAFTFAFSVLFNNNEIFMTPYGIVKTLMMVLGEMDYEDMFKEIMTQSLVVQVFGHIFLVVFLFLMPILFANLLIGLAVNDLPDLQKHGHTRRLVKQASYLVSYEQLTALMRFVICWKYCPFRKLIRMCTLPPFVTFSTSDPRCDLPKEILLKAVDIKSEESSDQGQEYMNLEALLEKTRRDQRKMDKKMNEILSIVQSLSNASLQSKSKTKIMKNCLK